MKNHRLHWIQSARAALALLAAGLALCSWSPCHAAPGQDASDLAAQFERLSKAALLAGRGSPDGFKQLRESREAFAQKLQALRSGAHYGLCTPLGLSDAAKARLASIADGWAQIDRAVATVAANEESMRQITAAVKQINDAEKTIGDLAESIGTLTLLNQRGPCEISAAQSMAIIHMRLVRNANLLLSGDVVDPETIFQLGRNANFFADYVHGLQAGSDALRLVAAEGEELGKLTELSTRFEADHQAVGVIRKNQQQLIVLKSAVQQIVSGGEAFFQSLLDLENRIGASAMC
jgi:twitching motility protein PilJ